MQPFLGSRFQIAPGFFLFGAICLFILPVQWFFGFLIASFAHEICHYICLKLLGIPVYSVTIGMSGAKIYTGAMQPFQELLSALSGPLGVLPLILLIHQFPYVALCAIFQTLFNLLPILPLDGGRAMLCLSVMLFGWVRGAHLVQILQYIFGILLVAGLMWIVLYLKLGLFHVLTVVFLGFRLSTVKFPCKAGNQIVQ